MMGVGDIQKTTPLYVEMQVCTELLHCTHSDFLKLPQRDRKKLMLYSIVRGMKMERETPSEPDVPPQLDPKVHGVELNVRRR